LTSVAPLGTFAIVGQVPLALPPPIVVEVVTNVDGLEADVLDVVDEGAEFDPPPQAATKRAHVTPSTDRTRAPLGVRLIRMRRCIFPHSFGLC
jgi:hypothetical protein